MSNGNNETKAIQPIKDFLAQEYIQNKFQDMLGKKAPGFMVSVIDVVSNNAMLAKADRNSILFSAATAAALDLPINPNLGFAYIVPYNQKGVTKAQFQMGYKGFIQLAMRSGQFKTINAVDIREGELVEEDRLTGEMKFSWIEDQDERSNAEIAGYAGYFELTNGFRKTLYLTVKELEQHGKRYSQSYKKGYGQWADNFDSMAKKTVIKLLLSKYAPLSIEMQTAVMSDQATGEDEYPDNEAPDLEEIQKEKEDQRIKDWIENSNTVEKLKEVDEAIEEKELRELYDKKMEELTKPKKTNSKKKEVENEKIEL